jgi:lysozyme
MPSYIMTGVRPLLLCLLLAAASARADTVDGIDVSAHQGDIAWPAVRKAGVRFAFIRAGDGATFADEHFAANWDGARAAGVLRGAYLFFRPEEGGADQAKVLIRAVGRLRAGDLPAVLDVEKLDGIDPAVAVRGIRDWLKRVKAATGRAPIVYTNAATWAALGSPDLGGAALWVAHWDVDDPAVPPPWSGWRFWQLSSAGRVDGIAGAVDLDRFQGAVADLEALAGIARRPAAAPRGLEAAPDGEQVALAWKPVAGATSYAVALRYRRGPRWADYHQFTAPASALVVVPQIELATFSWTVTACNHAGCSPASKPHTFDYKRW